MVSGFLGVDILFIVSGFVLFLPAAVNAGELGSLRSYAFRRFARIVPAYYVALGLVLVFHRFLASSGPPLLPTEPGLRYLTDWGPGYILSHLFLIHNYTAFPYEGFGVDGVVWTLTVEVTFYTLLPWISRTWFKRPYMLLVVALAVSELWQKFALSSLLTKNSDHQLWLAMQFPTYFAHFALGMTAAYTYVRVASHTSKTISRWAAVSMMVAGIVTAVFIHSKAVNALAGKVGGFDHIVGSGFIAVGFALLILSTSLAPKAFQRPFGNRPLRKLADVSYGIYLYHLPLIGLALTTLRFRDDGTNWSMLRMGAFVVPLAIAMGWMSYLIIERPARRAVRRRGVETIPDEIRPQAVPSGAQ